MAVSQLGRKVVTHNSKNDLPLASVTKQSVIHIWRGWPAGSKGTRNPSFFLLSMYAKDRDERVAGSDLKM